MSKSDAKKCAQDDLPVRDWSIPWSIHRLNHSLIELSLTEVSLDRISCWLEFSLTEVFWIEEFSDWTFHWPVFFPWLNQWSFSWVIFRMFLTPLIYVMIDCTIDFFQDWFVDLFHDSCSSSVSKLRTLESCRICLDKLQFCIHIACWLHIVYRQNSWAHFVLISCAPALLWLNRDIQRFIFVFSVRGPRPRHKLTLSIFCVISPILGKTTKTLCSTTAWGKLWICLRNKVSSMSTCDDFYICFFQYGAVVICR